MKKVLFIFISVFIISCNPNKKVKPIVCIGLIQYYEPPSRNMNQPSILINIKVEDSSVCKKLEGGQLNGLVIYSIKKEDRNRFFYNTGKLPIKKGNNYSFVLWTSYFSPNISDIENNKRREWESDDIIKALSGDVGLIFDKDTILATSCIDKKMIIETIND
jgi:hypothetical protein